MKIEDTLLTVLSDTHSGSSTALFPNRFVQFQHGNHTPTPKQQRMFGHFDQCAVDTGRRRKDRRLIVVHDGDAIDGDHHGTHQLVTRNKDEQKALHEELMDHFLQTADFSRKRGDKLYYVRGTESHTNDKEEEIAKSLRAEKRPDGDGRVFDHLELEINGRLLWFIHHGPKKGDGPNEGSALRLFLGRIFWTAVKDGRRPPDMVISGHTHAPVYNTYVMNFHTVHGIICPSWQAKTRFAYKSAPVETNRIGGVHVEIQADGEIRVLPFDLMETISKETVKV